MKKYVLSFAGSINHKPDHPERTATKQMQSFDIQYQVWTNRPAMAKSIRMQSNRESRYDDWRPCVKLNDGEGY
jgi:hypothetical protein